MKRFKWNRIAGYLFVTFLLLALTTTCKWPDVVDDNPEITLYILPSPVSGGTYELLEMRAVTEGEIPENAKYVWDFGDTSDKLELLNNNTASHLYFLPGTYIITIELFDNESGELIDKTTASAEISWNVYNLVHQYQYLQIDFMYNARMATDFYNENIPDQDIVSYGGFEITNRKELEGTTEDCPLTWDDHQFAATIGYTGRNIANQLVTRTGTITGELNEDGTEVTKLEAHQTDIIEVPLEGSPGEYTTMTRYTQLSLKNIPHIVISILPPYEVKYGTTGPAVNPLVLSHTNYYHSVGDEDWTLSQYVDYYEVLYDDPVQIPELYLYFTGPLFLE